MIIINDLHAILIKVKVNMSLNMLREKDINEMFHMIETIFELIKINSMLLNENTD